MIFTNQPSILNDCNLQSNRVDIWQYPLDAEYPQAQFLLSPDELIRANRFHFQKHRRRFTMAHSILRLILSRYSQIPPLELNFIAGPQGKPSLSNYLELEFNLSHSGDTALLAVGHHYPLGVDLEYFSDRPFLGIGETLFSKEENLALSNIHPSLQPFVFFNIWSQKEAFIKASGLGLSYPTQDFTVPILSSKPELVPDALHGRSWKIQSFMPKISCCAALCYEAVVEDIRYCSLNNIQLEMMYAEVGI